MIPRYGVIKGAPRIVYEELRAMLEAGERPSLSILAERTGYHYCTIREAISQLEKWGMVDVQRTRSGKRARYTVLEG